MIAVFQDEQGSGRNFVSKEVDADSNGVRMLTTNSVVNRHDAVCGCEVYAMYAIKITTDVYHLIQRGGQHTLCGLRVSPLISVRNGGRLQMVDALPMAKKM